jgi:hypothetical protein
MAEIRGAFLQLFPATEAKTAWKKNKVYESAHEMCYSFIKETAYERSVTTATLLQTRQDIFKGPPTFTTGHKE